jgi:epsilon-lactone hydrolase
MPSRESRYAAMGGRLFSAVTWRPRFPVRYQRFAMTSVVPRLQRPPADVTFEPVDAGGVRSEWVVPTVSDDDRAILYLHGGAFVIGGIESHRNMVGYIARAAGCRALVIDYRLAPEHPFPAALDDVLTAFRWLVSEGFAPEKMVIGGDSAGGCLTAGAMLSLKESGEPLPAAGFMLSPATDLAQTGGTFKTKAKEDPLIKIPWGDRCIGMYLGSTEATDPLASPLYADLQGLPPFLIQVGTREILLDDSLRFAERAKAAGVEVDLEVWDGMFHVWQIYCPAVPESRDAVKKIGAFCREKAAG